MMTIGISMDLSKAFDTIDHNILLLMIGHYGFRGITNDRFQNLQHGKILLVVFHRDQY